MSLQKQPRGGKAYFVLQFQIDTDHHNRKAMGMGWPGGRIRGLAMHIAYILKKQKWK